MVIIKSKRPLQWSSVFLCIYFKMNTIILLSLTFLALVVPAYGQFSLPFDTHDCAATRSLDPYWALKLKYPKKFNAKLDYAKDLLLDAKYKQAAKLLARHMKNLNLANCDLQNLMCQAQQPGLLQPVVYPDQNALAQQQQIASLQIPIDAARSLTLTPQADSQGSCFSQMTDPRYQQPTFQLTGMQSLSSLRPQQAIFQAGVPLQLS